MTFSLILIIGSNRDPPSALSFNPKAPDQLNHMEITFPQKQEQRKKTATQIANRKVEEYVVEKEYPRATQTIQNVITRLRNDSWHPAITNVCGSYGGSICIEHRDCAAIDITKRDIYDKAAYKDYLESLGLICESHWNYSGNIAPLEENESHFHCVDAAYLAERRKNN